MGYEDVLVGAVVAIAATYFGWWLQKRETKGLRAERERRIRSLLSEEISSNASQIIFARKLEERFDRAEKQFKTKLSHGPAEALFNRTAYDNIVADLTFLDEKVTKAILEAYSMFDGVNLSAREWRVSDEAEKKEFMYAIWKDVSRLAEKAAYDALRALGASSEVESLLGYGSWLDSPMSSSSKKEIP